MWIMNDGTVALMEYFCLSAKQKLRLWDAKVQVNGKTYLFAHSMPLSLCDGRTLVFGHAPTVSYQDNDPMRTDRHRLQLQRFERKAGMPVAG